MLKKGIIGEEIASRYLLRKGYSILKRNFKSSWGEIDIVALDPSDNTIVFVEVKLRKKDGLTEPLESVDYGKIQRIKKTAVFYLNNYKSRRDYHIRFDVVGVEVSDKKPAIIHIKDAF